MASRNTSHYTIPAFGGQDKNRTCNLTITNRVHCQLCYLAKFKNPDEKARKPSGPDAVKRLGFRAWSCWRIHATFNRPNGPRYRIRTGPICLEGRDACRWHQSRIGDLRFLSQPCINIISRFSRKIKFLHSKTYKLELWFEVAARKAHYRKMWSRSKMVPGAGLEPATSRVWTDPSTNWGIQAFICWPLHRVRRHRHQ